MTENAATHAHPLVGLLRHGKVSAVDTLVDVPSDGGNLTYLGDGLPVAVESVHHLVNFMSMRSLPAGMDAYLRLDVLVDLRVLDPKGSLKAPILDATVLLGLDAAGVVRFSSVGDNHMVVRAAEPRSPGKAVPRSRTRTGVVGEAVGVLEAAFRSWDATLLRAVTSRLRGMAAARDMVDTHLRERLAQREAAVAQEGKEWMERLVVSSADEIRHNIDEQARTHGILGMLAVQEAAVTGVPNDGAQRAAQSAARLIEERAEAVLLSARVAEAAERRSEERAAAERRREAREARLQAASERMLALLRDVAEGEDQGLGERARALLCEVDPA